MNLPATVGNMANTVFNKQKNIPHAVPNFVGLINIVIDGANVDDNIENVIPINIIDIIASNSVSNVNNICAVVQ